MHPSDQALRPKPARLPLPPRLPLPRHLPRGPPALLPPEPRPLVARALRLPARRQGGGSSGGGGGGGGGFLGGTEGGGFLGGADGGGDRHAAEEDCGGGHFDGGGWLRGSGLLAAIGEGDDDVRIDIGGNTGDGRENEDELRTWESKWVRGTGLI